MSGAIARDKGAAFEAIEAIGRLHEVTLITFLEDVFEFFGNSSRDEYIIFGIGVMESFKIECLIFDGVSVEPVGSRVSAWESGVV